MSRKEIVGEHFTIAFGVDKLMGAFAQIWVNPLVDQDSAIVRIDSFGVDVAHEPTPALTPQVQRWVEETVKRFDQFKSDHPGERPNIGEQDVIAMARVFGGFPDIAAEVYRLFGDDA